MTDQINFATLQGWCGQVWTAVTSCLTTENVKSLAANTTETAIDFAKEHPYRASAPIVSAGLALIFGAGWIAVPISIILRILGFTSLGPVAGKARITVALFLSS